RREETRDQSRGTREKQGVEKGYRRRILRRNRKWTFVVLAMIPLVAELLAGFREPLLAGMGRWLVAETPLQKADLVVALGGGQERQEEAARLLKQGLAQGVLFVGSNTWPRDYRCLDVPVVGAVRPP